MNLPQSSQCGPHLKILAVKSNVLHHPKSGPNDGLWVCDVIDELFFTSLFKKFEGVAWEHDFVPVSIGH